MSEQRQEVNCLCCGIGPTEFSDKEIEAMRSALAKMWRQTRDQVTDYEAVYYLRQERTNG